MLPSPIADPANAIIALARLPKLSLAILYYIPDTSRALMFFREAKLTSVILSIPTVIV